MEIPDVAYDDRFGEATTMDVYLPDDELTDRPAVLLIHGGGWSMFSKQAYIKQGRRLAGAGYVAAAINYRLTPDGVYPRAMQDSACALATLRAHAEEWGLDPRRVAVMGYSAGGHLASVLGVAIDEPDFQPDCAAGSTFAPAAVISGAGPQDLRELAWADAVQALIGGTLEEYPDRYERASPLARVRSGAPPFLLIHGTQDLFIDVDQSVAMRDALRAVGTDARLLTLAGGGHLLNSGADVGQVDGSTSADTPEAWAAIIDFLDRTIGPTRVGR
ncbi:MAG TPA: alpha/beta hydrolase [Kofleriaceae bacterium]|nr:alpha/beta hydrolase [Kofleriaceae bacterium]